MTGSRGGTAVYNDTLVVDCLSPTWFDFNYDDIDELHFRSLGGTRYPPYLGISRHFVLDNFTYIPEPATLLLICGAAAPVLLKRRRS